MKERGQTDRPCKMSWKFLSDLLSKSTPISATHLHRTTTLQWRLCIRYHVFFFRSPPSPPSLPFHPFTSPITLPHCKVRVAKFKSQNECRLGASRVYIGHPFVCIFAYSSTPRVNLYVCICVFLCVSACCCACEYLQAILAICENPSYHDSEIIVVSM